jgi:hypothetical protein
MYNISQLLTFVNVLTVLPILLPSLPVSSSDLPRFVSEYESQKYTP